MAPSRCAWTLSFYKAANYYDRPGRSKDFSKMKKKFLKKNKDFMSDEDLRVI